MLSFSMLSMPASSAEEAPQTSYLPAIVAIGCAWSIALMRGILGLFRHEHLDLDMALTGLLLVAIPVIAFRIRRVERRAPPVPVSDIARRKRPRLVLISSH